MRALAAVLAVSVSAGLPEPGPSAEILDRHGSRLRTLLSSEESLSSPVRLDAVSPWVVLATLAAEDRRFYGHAGVDLRAVLRALWQNARAGRTVSGGSTLTQQLVRILERAPRTFRSKLREAVSAVLLERRLDKPSILEAYLNRAPYGSRILGIEAAAQAYFGMPARELSLGQAALLAGIPKSPSRLDPARRPAETWARQRRILKRMRDWGWLDESTYQLALSERSPIRSPSLAFSAAHFTERVRRETAGRRIRTTLDRPLQEGLEAILRSHLQGLGAYHVTNGAVVALDNSNGEVLAWVGSADFLDAERQGQVDGAAALRQPGSALKPFLYGRALAEGWRPADLLEDLPTRAPDGFTPRNYDESFHGPVRLREALACSYNVPAVRLTERLGVGKLLDTLRAFGFSSLQRRAEHYGLGLALGNGEVSLLELASAYSALARGGVWMPARIVLEPRQELPEAKRALDRESSYLVTDILSDNAARAPAFGLNSPLHLPFPFAAKTGTTKDYRDNWAVGYTPGWTVAVWVGNFDNTPMRRVSGITGAAPVLRDAAILMEQRFGSKPFPVPAGIRTAEVCTVSGRLAGPFCPERMEEVFSVKALPDGPCREHGPAAAGAAAPLAIDFPRPGDVFRIDRHAPRASQGLRLAATGKEGRGLFWAVDGRSLAGDGPGVWWTLEPGSHAVTLTWREEGRLRRAGPVHFLVFP